MQGDCYALTLLGRLYMSFIFFIFSPDNSPAPFILKPLAGDVTDTNRALNNIVSGNIPSVIVTIED